MGQIIETKINRFDGGVTADPRKNDKRFCRVVKHFDILTAANRLDPYIGITADGTVGDTEKLCQFLSANSKQYALGVVSGTSRAKVFERASLPVGAWTASTTGEDGTGTNRSETLFIEYKDIIYGASRINATTTQLWSYAYLTNTFTDAAFDLGTVADLSAITIPVVGLVHSKDDILYIGYDNRIIKKDGAGAFAAALALPTNQVVTSICEYGNFLAIACKSKYSGGKSIVYLWDRDSTVSTLSEKIDWGVGALLLLEELEDELIGISVNVNTAATLRPRMVFKYRVGTGARQFAEIPCTNIPANSVGTTKQKANNRMLFHMGIQMQNVQQNGIWSIGRSIDSGNFAVSLDRVLSTDITDTTFFVPLGFQLLEDYMTVAYTNSTYFTVRTIGDGTFLSPSAYESLILNFGDSDITKKLVGVTVMYEPLPSAGQVVLKYRINEETSWTTIFTKTYSASDLPGNISHGAVNIESSGVNLREFKEAEFRIESTGGAVITGLKCKAEVMDKSFY